MPILGLIATGLGLSLTVRSPTSLQVGAVRYAGREAMDTTIVSAHTVFNSSKYPQNSPMEELSADSCKAMQPGDSHGQIGMDGPRLALHARMSSGLFATVLHEIGWYEPVFCPYNRPNMRL